ncbi:MAG: carbohydrate ABC transporter permease [Candidatus Nanopelagicales bacterium]
MTTISYKKATKVSLKYVLISIVLFIVLFPFFYLVATSFRPQIEFLADVNVIPKNFTLEHYQTIFASQRAFRYFSNSVLITTIVTVVSIFAGTIAGYALARSKFKLQIILAIIFMFIFIRFYPRIAIVVPWFLIMNDLRLLDTIWAVIILHLGLTVPFVVWLMYTFFKGIPVELDECAAVDGAGFVKRFVKVILPLSMPGIASASIFTAFLSWNEFLLASAVTREAAKPLTVTIAGFVTDKGTLWGPMMAMSALVVLPMVIFALWLQKYLVKGIMLGAVKE